MAKAAEAQTKTLGGQWNLLTGNIQKLSGAATESLAAGLREKALPAVNEAVQQITEIFGREGLSNEQKLAEARKVIVRELGPVWHELAQEIDDADIPGKLGDAVAAATPTVLDAMADIAPQGREGVRRRVAALRPGGAGHHRLFLGNRLRKSDFGKALFTERRGSGKSARPPCFGGRGDPSEPSVGERSRQGGRARPGSRRQGGRAGSAGPSRVGARREWAASRNRPVAAARDRVARATQGSNHNFDLAATGGIVASAGEPGRSRRRGSGTRRSR
jgi:hypothetical protein